MTDKKETIDLLFETSWEVCNKIGGIYAVLSTKAKTLQKLYKDKTIFIGPDVWSEVNPSPFFIPSDTILKAWRKNLNLPHGVSVRVGRWDVPGSPIAILVKFDTLYLCKDELYSKMWELYGVDSLHAYGDYDEACAFSHAAAIVIESLYKFKKLQGKRVIAHFDEWTTGMGLLITKWKLPEVATIFTTHATSIGRSICGNNKPLYDYLRGYHGDQMAEELNMQSKHSLEKAAAHQADCFTTVSEVTATECEQLLDLRPNVVTPNGFEAGFVPAKANYEQARQDARKKLIKVANALTGKHFKSSNTFFIATSGRCEYRNKGLDVYLDSLDRLRQIRSGNTPEVVAFIMVPSWISGARADLQNALKKKQAELTPLWNPNLTHNLVEPDHESVYCHLRHLQFNNTDGVHVNVIYVPSYLTGTDGIFNMPYYDLLIGMDATVFPSYYEPWGYTPLESIAFGVPTITTSLAGFGQWVKSDVGNGFDKSGVEVINRTDANYHQVADEIAAQLNRLIDMPATEKTEVDRKAMSTAEKASWQYFMDYYLEAFEVALRNEARRTGHTLKTFSDSQLTSINNHNQDYY